MNKIARQKKIKGLFDSKVFLVFLVILAFFLGKSSFAMYKQHAITKSMVQSVNKEYESLNSRYFDAQKDLDYINSNTGREKEIREKFDFGREGEKAIFIVDDKMSTSTEKEKGSFEDFLTNVKGFFGF